MRLQKEMQEIQVTFFHSPKCERWKSEKFKGVRKDIQNLIVVVFSNAMPNISTLSVDRWMIFHTSLG